MVYGWLIPDYDSTNGFRSEDTDTPPDIVGVTDTEVTHVLFGFLSRGKTMYIMWTVYGLRELETVCFSGPPESFICMQDEVGAFTTKLIGVHLVSVALNGF